MNWDYQKLHTLLRGDTGEWLGALLIATAIVMFTILIKRVLVRRLGELAKRTSTSLDDALVRALAATKLSLVVVLALYAGSHNIELPKRVAGWLDVGATVAFFLQVGLWFSALLEFWVNRSRSRAMASNVGAATSLSALSFIARAILWALVLLLTLDNLGVNITALVAGLGISGIAVALAVQNILGDLFASLSIVIDKPFVIGDFIVVDNYMGTVENVGLKTTRIRSVDGEQIIFSNGDLLKSRVRNYKAMYERRVVFGFDVIYETPVDLLEKIPALLRGFVEAQKKVRFDRAHLQGLKDNSLHFEMVYWVLDANYNLYMDIQQNINLAVLRTLSRAGVQFAYSNNYLSRAPASAAKTETGSGGSTISGTTPA